MITYPWYEWKHFKWNIECSVNDTNDKLQKKNLTKMQDETQIHSLLLFQTFHREKEKRKIFNKTIKMKEKQNIKKNEDNKKINETIKTWCCRHSICSSPTYTFKHLFVIFLSFHSPKVDLSKWHCAVHAFRELKLKLSNFFFRSTMKI